MSHEIEHHLRGIEHTQERILHKLDALSGKETDLMAAVQDVKQILTDIDVATTDLGTRIGVILDQMASGSVSPSEMAELKALGDAEVARLKGFAANPTTPVPPVSPQLAALRAKHP